MKRFPGFFFESRSFPCCLSLSHRSLSLSLSISPRSCTIILPHFIILLRNEFHVMASTIIQSWLHFTSMGFRRINNMSKYRSREDSNLHHLSQACLFRFVCSWCIYLFFEALDGYEGQEDPQIPSILRSGSLSCSHRRKNEC
jgi:hypothetical protein